MEHKRPAEEVSRTVLKALALLDVLEQEEPLGLTELARRVGMPKPTAYRLLNSLVETGLVRWTARGQNGAGGYGLGYRLLELGNVMAERIDLRRLALPTMRALRDQTGDTVHLVVRDGLDAVYIEKVDSQAPIRLYTRVGRRLPLHVGACPRTLLAYAEPEVVEQVLSGPLHPITEATITRPAELRRALEVTRRSGYTVGYGEAMPGTYAIAAPIYDHQGQVAAVVSVGGPVRHAEDNLDRLIDQVRGAALEISRQLGYRGEPR
ncbi:MAG TPA: IclR family transcriptional regulator [Bacillota bacterium]